jgi:hypothetical protein
VLVLPELRRILTKHLADRFTYIANHDVILTRVIQDGTSYIKRFEFIDASLDLLNAASDLTAVPEDPRFYGRRVLSLLLGHWTSSTVLEVNRMQ